MNVERTIEFILQHQAKAEVEMAAIRKQQAKAQGEMAAIRKLMRAGMKMLAEDRQLIRDLAKSQQELAQAQKATEATLRSFIDSMRRGGNGAHRRN